MKEGSGSLRNWQAASCMDGDLADEHTRVRAWMCVSVCVCMCARVCVCDVCCVSVCVCV